MRSVLAFGQAYDKTVERSRHLDLAGQARGRPEVVDERDHVRFHFARRLDLVSPVFVDDHVTGGAGAFAAAVGVGAALVLASDLAIGCPQATFSAPETLRGLVPGLVAPLLTFRCGAGLAARLCLTNETLSPAQAHHHGIYQELVADDLIWARAHEIGMQCVQSPHEAVALTKRLINETIGEHLATWLTLGAAASATARTTESALEGVAAFLKK